MASSPTRFMYMMILILEGKPSISWQTCFWRNLEYSRKKPGWDLRNSYDNWSYFMIVITVVDLGHQPVELFVHYYSKHPKHFQSEQTRATHHGNHVLWYSYADLYMFYEQTTYWVGAVRHSNMIFNWCEMHIMENEVFFPPPNLQSLKQKARFFFIHGSNFPSSEAFIKKVYNQPKRYQFFRHYSSREFLAHPQRIVTYQLRLKKGRVSSKPHKPPAPCSNPTKPAPPPWAFSASASASEDMLRLRCISWTWI